MGRVGDGQSDVFCVRGEPDRPVRVGGGQRPGDVGESLNLPESVGDGLGSAFRLDQNACGARSVFPNDSGILNGRLVTRALRVYLTGSRSRKLIALSDRAGGD